MNDHTDDLAEERTEWAEDRTILANERTFAAWIRTGLAIMAIALGLRALFAPIEPAWVPKLVAEAFLFIAILIFWAARQKAADTHRRLTEHSAHSQSTARITTLATLLSLGAAATGAILWVLP